MPFCGNCGQELPPSSIYCPRCGASIVEATSSSRTPSNAATSSSSGGENQFDRLTHESGVQDLWLKRVIAFVIDAIIVGIATFIVALIAYVIVGVTTGAFFGLYTGSGFSFVPFFNPLDFGIFGFSALFYLLYFTFLEANYQRTIGKGFMNLHVVTIDGSRVGLGKAFLRNLSKVYWLLLLLDLIGGLFMRDVATGQKFSDHFANTNVVLGK